MVSYVSLSVLGLLVLSVMSESDYYTERTMDGRQCSGNGIVKVNIGGQVFITTLTTLSKTNLFENEQCLEFEDGLFVDKEPQFFEDMVYFLRYGSSRFSFPTFTSLTETSRHLLLDSLFYGMPDSYFWDVFGDVLQNMCKMLQYDLRANHANLRNPLESSNFFLHTDFGLVLETGLKNSCFLQFLEKENINLKFTIRFLESILHSAKPDEIMSAFKSLQQDYNLQSTVLLPHLKNLRNRITGRYQPPQRARKLYGEFVKQLHFEKSWVHLSLEQTDVRKWFYCPDNRFLLVSILTDFEQIPSVATTSFVGWEEWFPKLDKTDQDIIKAAYTEPIPWAE